MGINVDGKCLNNLRFIDDIELIADMLDQAQIILQELHTASVEVGLRVNFTLT